MRASFERSSATAGVSPSFMDARLDLEWELLPPRSERRNPALVAPRRGFAVGSLEPIAAACVCHLADGRGNRPWRVGQTSIGDARNSAWRWRVRLESAKRALPYPTWRRSGCGWRRGNPPSQYSSSNNKFSPRTTIRRNKDPLSQTPYRNPGQRLIKTSAILKLGTLSVPESRFEQTNPLGDAKLISQRGLDEGDYAEGSYAALFLPSQLRPSRPAGRRRS